LHASAQTLIAPPEVDVDAIRRLVGDDPVTDLVVSGPGGGVPLRTRGYESIKLFADKVLPVIKSL
jgi:hypothetical protein